MSALNRKLLRDLWHIRGQALAIATVIACGVSTVVMSFGTLESLEITRDAYYEQQRFADVFAHLKRAPASIRDEIARIDGVRSVDTRIVEAANLDVAGMDEPVLGRLISLPRRGAVALNQAVLRRGRLPDGKRPDEAILSEPFADAHGLLPGDQIQATINGHKRRLDIVGIALSPEYIYAIGPGVIMPDDERFGIVWMGREAMAASFDLKSAFNDVSLSLMRSADKSAVIRQLDQILAPWGGIGAYGRADQISHAFVANEMEQLRSLGNIVPPIFLAVAAFLLNVVISRIITTEREEIGLMKAFGYSNLAVGVHYLKLVLLITAVGVALGFLVGAWFGRAVTELYADLLFRFPVLYFRFDLQIFAAAGGVSLAASGLGALGAIRSAVNLPPAVAMQPAAPTVYHRGLLNRMGLSKGLSQPTLMILRHLGRWPIRAGLTTLGISMAVAILVASLFFFDAVEHLLDIYFHHGQRQDATVVFSEPRDIGAMVEIGHLPGVMAAEPYRAVAVKLHLGARSERGSITGLDGETTLHRVLDRDLNAVSLPHTGLVLSTQLAEMLNARTGMRVRVEVLEGRRPVVDVPVTSIVEEYIAAPAYMRRAALNKLMGEGRLISGVYLQVDSQYSGQLYRHLKETPAVAGVSLQTAALDTFRKTMAETLNIMLFFYVLFGALIAIGVVYNSARVSLSERGRELASLRVLGFTRGEVSYILLGELTILTLVALPLGCIFGLGLAHVMVSNLNTELFRVPMVVAPATFAVSMLTVIAASAASGLIVRRRIDRFDLVAVLKTRE
ncbi:MAG: ABC transporter permease [Alphaproteobacteria bacterium]|jgi:putative ABC transport system permease protein|nr:ABC transporter permease [Alphaproteobacteria bacterium]MDP6830955.1 ABC transporter permease [Alphaproteobacteria bacterium]